MGIEDIFVWYQQKIGTYDKQQWETRIEQKEQRIYGLTHIQMRKAKPETELIDLDLVRGSSFTKAKPQQGFIKVARLATLRFILLPFYGKWWLQQTSGRVFIFTLVLYIIQIINVINYFIHTSKCIGDTDVISCMEIFVPFIMMWILCLIHSQIVSTSPTDEEKDLKFTRYSYVRNSIRMRRRLNKVKARRHKNEKVKFIDVVSIDEQSSSENFNRSNLNLRQDNIENDVKNTDMHIDDNQIDLNEEKIVPGGDTNISDLIDILAGINQNSLPSKSQTDKVQNIDSSNEIPQQCTSETAAIKKINDHVDSVNQNHTEDAASNCNYCKIEKRNPQKSKVLKNQEPNGNSYDKCETWVKQHKDDLKQTSDKSKCLSSDSEREVEEQVPIIKKYKKTQLLKRRNSHIPTINIIDSTCDTEDEILSSPETRISEPLLGEVTSSATEWMGVTTNSEDCSYSSDMDDVSDANVENTQDYFAFDNDLAPTAILNPPSVKVSCTLWDRDEIKKADLSMLDISSVIIGKVDYMPASMDYFYIGMIFSTILGFLPVICRISGITADGNSTERFLVGELYKNVTNMLFSFKPEPSIFEIYRVTTEKLPEGLEMFLNVALGITVWERTIVMIALLQRWILASVVFFLLSVAERTFKQRLLYAKLFSHLTSSRRARKSDLPHFRLNKVRNIKTWLSVRSYLKKRGPQRSVDVIVSTAFIVTLLLLTFLCVELLKDTVSFSQYYLEALLWCLGLGILLLRFMTLGTKINRKYRNLSVLITEQINLHLQIEQKPHKKDELTVANNVLKLAIDLLKELESPFKISGLSANPILYNVTKLIILSALSGVLSEMLGFKLKLHKIKLK